MVKLMQKNLSPALALAALALNLSVIHEAKAAGWIVTGGLATARYWHTATLLPNGKALVAGGQTSSGMTNSAECTIRPPGRGRRPRHPR